LFYVDYIVFYFFIIGKLQSSGDVLATDHQKEQSHGTDISKLNSTPPACKTLTTNLNEKSHSIQTNCRITSELLTGNILSSNSLKFFSLYLTDFQLSFRLRNLRVILLKIRFIKIA
jgi:hypothetical protein